MTYGEAVEQVRTLLTEAVRIRLVSDVPLGAFLSGGLDSSTIVALMRQATTGTIRTCSMVFGEEAFCKGAMPKQWRPTLAPNIMSARLPRADLVDEFDNILLALDQPSIDGVNSYFVSQTARQARLTVALSGLGGDELLGGYPNTFGDVPRIYNLLHTVRRLPGTSRLTSSLTKVYNKNGWQRLADAFAQPASLGKCLPDPPRPLQPRRSPGPCPPRPVGRSPKGIQNPITKPRR